MRLAKILDPGPGEPKQCPKLLNKVPSNHCIAYDVTNLGVPSSMLQHGDEVKPGVLRISLVSPLASLISCGFMCLGPLPHNFWKPTQRSHVPR